MNTDSHEFTAILNRVPMWHMLTPLVDKWKDGDEYLLVAGFNKKWSPILREQMYGYPVSDETIFRRPIPESVRRSVAWWALYNKLATVAPQSPRTTLIVVSDLLNRDGVKFVEITGCL